LNKISKKIVSLVTMATFAVTLVPAAAFAAEPNVNEAAAAASSYEVVSDQIAGTADISFDLNTAKDTALDPNTNKDARLFVELTGGNAANAKVTYEGLAEWFDDNLTDSVSDLTRDAGLGVGSATPSVDITGLAAGTYTMTVAIDVDGLNTGADPVEIATKTFTVLNPASANASKIVIDDKTEVAVDQYDKETVEFDLRNVNNKVENADYLQNVKVWATDADGNFTDAVTFTTVAGEFEKCTNNSHFYKFLGTVTEDTTFEVTFERGGTYYIYAGVGDVADNANTVAASLGKGFEKFNEGNGIKAEVTAKAVTTDYITLTGKDVTGDYTLKLDNEKKIYDINLVGYKGWDANGTAEYTLTGVAHQKDGSVAENQEITLTSGADKNLLFGGKDASVTVKTDRNGEFKTTFTMNDKRNVPITITVGDKKFTVRIVTETSRAYDIDATVDGGYVLAGTDTDNWTNGNNSADFSDAVQFVITDEAGDVLTGDDAEMFSEPATWDATAESSLAAEHAKYVNVLGRADKSTLDAADLRLIPAGDHWTLAYVGNNATKDLTPGKYTVRVALLSGDYVEITFNAAEFGTVTDLDVKLVSHDQSTNRDLVLDDEVTLGQFVTATTQYVDENGIKIAAPRQNVRYGFDGKAVVDKDFFNGTFWTRADEISNEELLGTTIIVTAFDGGKNIDVQKTLTVVDSYNSFDLEFDPTEGPVNDEQDVAVTVVKADGEKAQVNGKLYAYIEDQSNDDAVVTVDVKKNVTNGKGELVVYASEPTEVTIRVAVEDTSNQGLYVASLDYTAGDGSIFAHHNVVMTIGSSQYVVDKQLFTMDAAPYVDSNWRTMVPIRALAEAFDATVTYDNDDRTVTIEYNEETIVMTVDDATYTVNGVEGEMDTEAVIKGDRTYVPIRFAAEAMGFTVTALYDENSSTASVVFQS